MKFLLKILSFTKSKLKHSKKLLSSGFSLIEILIAGGILTVVALGLSTMMLDTQRTSKSISATTEANDFINMISMLLLNPISCSATFMNVPIDTANTTTDQALGTIFYAGAGATITTPVRGAAAATGGVTPVPNRPLKVNAIVFRVNSFAGATNWNADVIVRLEKVVPGGAIGGSSIERRFPVLLNVTGTNVTDCSLSNAASRSVFRTTSPGCVQNVITANNTCQTVICRTNVSSSPTFDAKGVLTGISSSTSNSYFDCAGNCNQSSPQNCANTADGKYYP